MMTDYNISGTSLSIIAAVGLVLFFLFILGGRYYLARRTERYLATRANNPDAAPTSKAIRKYEGVDVFKIRSIFMYLGLIGVLTATVSAFNWTDMDDGTTAQVVAYDMDFDLEVEPPPPTAEAPPPPPPPPPTVIQEVPKDLILEEEEIEFIDQSIDAEASVDGPVFEEKAAAPPPPPPPPPPPREEKVAEIFKIVEEMPRFPGCETASTDIQEKKACSDQKLMEYIYSKIDYPSVARENGIEGMVVIGFVVNVDGTVSEAKILRDIGGGCGTEALEVVNSMNDLSERWVPGRQRSVPVRVMFSLPIRFKMVTATAGLN